MIEKFKEIIKKTHVSHFFDSSEITLMLNLMQDAYNLDRAKNTSRELFPKKCSFTGIGLWKGYVLHGDEIAINVRYADIYCENNYGKSYVKMNQEDPDAFFYTEWKNILTAYDGSVYDIDGNEYYWKDENWEIKSTWQEFLEKNQGDLSNKIYTLENLQADCNPIQKYAEKQLAETVELLRRLNNYEKI